VPNVALLGRLAGSLWFRLLVSAGLLAIVATQIDFHALRGGLTEGSWPWLAAAVAVLFASFVVGALRWHVFLEAARVGSTRTHAIRAYLIGAFTTNFLPTQLGGDVTRAWVASGQGTRVRSITTVVLDRATALGCLIVVGWIGVSTEVAAVPGQLVAALAAATAAYALACLLCALLFRLGPLRRRLPEKLGPAARDARGALVSGLAKPVLWRTFAGGLAFQGLVYVAAWLIARSISLDVPFAVLGAVLAPVMILSTAPVSIGGLGVREGSYVLLLGYAGVTATDATLFSLLSGAVFALASLPGALALLISRTPVRPPETLQDRSSTAT
jgi:glycosyltransferase 2 family protein